MSQTFSDLKRFIVELTEAFHQDDWELVAKLNLTATEVVGECANRLGDDAEKDEFRRLLTELQSVYAGMSSANIERRTGLATELKQLHKEHNAISQYLQSSSY